MDAFFAMDLNQWIIRWGQGYRNIKYLVFCKNQKRASKDRHDLEIKNFVVVCFSLFLKEPPVVCYVCKYKIVPCFENHFLRKEWVYLFLQGFVCYNCVFLEKFH